MVSRCFGLLIAVSVVAAAQGTGNPVQLLQTGTFHAGEVTAQSGERWLGLSPTRSGFAWRSFRIATKRVQDLIVDPPGEQTGIAVSANGNPLFLLKGRHLLGKPVRTAWHDPRVCYCRMKDPRLPARRAAAYQPATVTDSKGDDYPNLRS
jgi:hypothetical protein